MYDLQPARRSRSGNRCSPVLALLIVTAELPACGNDAEAPTETATDTETHGPDAAKAMPTSPCLWETDELLSRVDAPAPELEDCGLFLGLQQPLDNDCFTNGLETGHAVQITINNCTDCMIHSTYVSTPSAGKFHLYREADYYGDQLREVRVDSCTNFVAGSGSGANCAGSARLYACSDPLPAPSDL
jgi:hypothetical protein